MSIRICANEFLLKPAVLGITKSEKRYARGSICLRIPLSGGDDSHQDPWVNFIASDEKLAERLSGRRPKSKIGFAGELSLNIYQGNVRPNVVIDEVISVQKPRKVRAEPDDFLDEEVEF